MTETPQPRSTCPHCGTIVAEDVLSCPQCQTLIYSEWLETLAARAQHLEEVKLWADARDLWLAALSKLPHASRQAEWTRNHVQQLDAVLHATDAPAIPQKQEPQLSPRWRKWLGPLAPVAVVLIKAKGLLLALFKLKFLLSFAAFFGLYWALYGFWFGLGFAFSILVHEMGHYIAVRRLGMKAELPVFLPGFGAYVRWQMTHVEPDGSLRVATLFESAQVALAGPIAGMLCSAGFFGLYLATGQPAWAAVAHAGAWLNLLNLIPVWFLDGARAADALNKVHRVLLLLTAILLGVLLGQGGYYLVALGLGWRIFFTKDAPEHGSNRVMVVFVLLLFALGLLFGFAPMRAVR
ncbi:site-2 protease family protein [Terriglobus tenax]|uniref:site-2 protease family protein n=1 Tax=Terriglobus tenax TaxID=1111115 RepID=UPI0021E0503D|nr:site-2 protease family protein [Terriglobus tenax]